MGIRNDRRGQAFIELALGMLALSLVLASRFSFAAYISGAMKLQQETRASAGRKAMHSNALNVTETRSDSIEVEEFAAEWIFKKDKIEMKEKVVMPSLSIPVL